MSFPAVVTTSCLPSDVILCQLNELQFAVPLEDVVQAILRPSDITQMPRRDSAMEGILPYRGQVLPLLDIRRWLPWPGDQQAVPAQVLVLKQNGMLFGMVIDAVHGLHKISDAQIQRLHQADDEKELFHSAIRLQQQNGAQSSVGLLDVSALAKLTQVWAADAMESMDADGERIPAASAQTTIARNGLYGSYALFAVADKLIGIESQYVAGVVPMPDVQKVLGSDASWRGMTHWRGRDIPVLDTMVSLGLAQLSGALLPVNIPGETARKAPDTDSAPVPDLLLVILMHDERCIGLPVHAAHAVMRLDTSAAQTAAIAGLPVNPILRAVQELPQELSDGRSVFLADGSVWVNACPMSVLSRTDVSSKKERGHRHAHVVVQAGQVWAIGLHWLQAIIAMPEKIDAVSAGYAGQLGTLIWNSRTLPLLDLGMLTNNQVTQINNDCKVLIVCVNNVHLGILVGQLMMLLPARTGELASFSRNGSNNTQMITVRNNEQLRSYGILDPESWLPLQAILQRMQPASPSAM
ncbi:chemotaxis protein CheW [Undibacterium sp. SXout7W]|uniref:chemotaxis protein CheW n=1 Tax=Undibacterium sp. SXout7W TaxID=3413049 RepID=UPI003BF11964